MRSKTDDKQSPPGAAAEGLRERNKRDKLARLAQAARELFATQGFHETTIRQLAARAGIGVGTVFLYVKDKEALLQLLFTEAVLGVQDQAFASLAEAAGPGGGADLVDEMVHIFGRFYRYYASDRTLSRLFIKELLFMPVELSQQHLAMTMQFIGRLGERVAAAQARGEVRSDAPAMLVAMNFFSAYFLVLVGLLDAAQGASMSVEDALDMLRRALSLQLAGLRPQPPAPPVPTEPGAAPSKARRAAAAPRRGKRAAR